MIWATWRLQRTETVIAALLLAFAAAVLVPTGLNISHAYDHDGIAACLTNPTGDCRDTLELFARRWEQLVNLVAWFNLLPGLIGVLLAVPLVLELEHGTYRLAWTQSVTRDRWLATRIAAIVVTTVAAAVAFTLVMTWWRSPIDHVRGRFEEGFNFEGLVPTAYALFAAALVLATGVVLRRAAAAIGITLAVFVALRLVIEGWVRQNYLAPLHRTWTGSAEPDLHGAWVMSQGRELHLVGGGRPDPGVVASCFQGPPKFVDGACLARHGIVEYAEAVYHPASRFWLFQGIEAGIFLTLALALGTFAVIWIRRRVV